MKLVTLFMDVEDPINPLADDAALDFAALFAEIGVRGSFCVTGEKCRKLVERGRRDVIEALSDHWLGLHTDTHSYHPTTMELLCDLNYSAGCDAALHSESRGVDAFRAAFHRTPSFWGGAGNTWSPEIPHALAQLGIPAYAYALTELPGKRVHRFNGSLALPQSVSVGEDAIADDPESIARTLDAIDSASQPWVGVFVGHPTRYRFAEFWDRSYFAGKTPEGIDSLEPVSEERYARSKRNFAILIREISAAWRVVGVDELLAMPWTFSEPLPTELEYFKEATEYNLRNAAKWPINRPDMDTDKIVKKTLALAHTLEVGNLA